MRQSGSNELLDAVLPETIPMYGRMIHTLDSKGSISEEAQQYDVHGRYQRAVDRANLNKIFLDQLERCTNVKLFFHYKLTGVDFEGRKAWFEQKWQPSQAVERPREVEAEFDVILGCDGAHSSTRYHMMKYLRMDYEQTYIDVLWSEFIIPPMENSNDVLGTTASAKDGFATSPNHLHIWPGKDNMFIAIPSTDKSFTCTLFAPSATFAQLEEDPHRVEPFFQTNFPGAAHLIGPHIRKQFETNPHLPLISIKCSPHCYKSSGVILGDAAHAMVPFYGQGMNAGLEDVRVLFQHLDEHPSTIEGRSAALESYNRERVPDAHTINDLALDNYWEMHAGVQSPAYLVRKNVEELLSDKVPSTGFETQYSRVSFSNQRYSEVSKAVERQRKILIGSMVGLLLVPATAWAAWWLSLWNRAGRPAKGSLKMSWGLRELPGIVTSWISHLRGR